MSILFHVCSIRFTSSDMDRQDRVLALIALRKSGVTCAVWDRALSLEATKNRRTCSWIISLTISVWSTLDPNQMNSACNVDSKYVYHLRYFNKKYI